VFESQHIFTFLRDYRAFVAALRHGDRCEIDEPMFIHWLESSPRVYMCRDVMLCDHSEVNADFVIADVGEPGALQAFWQCSESSNPSDRRYFAQRAHCLV